MEQNPPKNSTWKRVAILIIGLLVVAGLAIGMIALLRTLFAPTPPQAEVSTTSVAEVINGIKTTGTIKALENYQEQPTEAPNGRITTSADNKNYAINIPTKYSVLFFAKTPGQQADIATVEQQVSTFMLGKGYSKTENTGPAKGSGNPLYTTYKSSAGICQLASAQPGGAQTGFAYHTIACSENASIAQEYTTIEMLLALYKKERELPQFTEASRIVIAEDNKMLSILSLSGGSSTSLLFAAIDGNWEYIGNGNSGTNSSGKYAISPDIQSKIDDARWGDFLKKNLR